MAQKMKTRAHARFTGRAGQFWEATIVTVGMDMGSNKNYFLRRNAPEYSAPAAKFCRFGDVLAAERRMCPPIKIPCCLTPTLAIATTALLI